jgi:hypothetical protein
VIKNVLSERLAHWLNKVLGAGRIVPSHIAGDVDEDASDVEGDADAKPRNSKVMLVEHAGGAADVPPGAIVTAEQAESALGHVQATDLDADIFESLDEDQKEEEIALLGRIVNPPLLTYDCIAWSPVSNSELANIMGWHPPLLLKHLTAAAFTCTGAQVRATLEESFIALRQYFVEEMSAPDAIFKLAASVESLDPTQLVVYKSITEWAQRRYNWEQKLDSVRAPELQFLLLGTAGTGKRTLRKPVSHKCGSCFTTSMRF